MCFQPQPGAQLALLVRLVDPLVPWTRRSYSCWRHALTPRRFSHDDYSVIASPTILTCTRRDATAPHPDVFHITAIASSRHRRSSRARDATRPIKQALSNSTASFPSLLPPPSNGRASAPRLRCCLRFSHGSPRCHRQAFCHRALLFTNSRTQGQKGDGKVSLRQSLLAKGRSVHPQQGQAAPSHMDRVFPLPGEGGQSIPHTGENQSRISHATLRQVHHSAYTRIYSPHI